MIGRRMTPEHLPKSEICERLAGNICLKAAWRESEDTGADAVIDISRKLLAWSFTPQGL